MAKPGRARPEARARGKARSWWPALKARLALPDDLLKPLRDPLLLMAYCLVGLSLVDGYVWIGALVSELAFPLSLLLLVLAVTFGVRGQRVRAGALIACAAFFVSGSLPYLRATRPTPLHGPTLRVAQAHAAGAPLPSARFASWLAQSRVDLVSLTGLRARDARALQLEASGYERLPDLRSATQLLWIKRTLLTSSHARAVRLGGCRLELAQVDLPSLFAADRLVDRRREIASLARNAQAAPQLYVGHLGSSSDAADLAPLRESRELRDARVGHGRLASAPDPLGALGLPVDHILLRGWILAREVTVEPPLAPGMHRTLLATLELTEPRCARLKAPRRP